MYQIILNFYNTLSLRVAKRIEKMVNFLDTDLKRLRQSFSVGAKRRIPMAIGTTRNDMFILFLQYSDISNKQPSFLIFCFF